MSLHSLLEIIATLTGILCVGLQSKEKILAWPLGIISVTISAYIFLQSRLYADMGLHVIYIILNAYGWYYWSANKDHLSIAPTKIMDLKLIFQAGLLVIFLTIILGFLLGRYTNAELYYYDAFTTSGSLVAQYLLAKKYLQNWLLWILVDCVAIPVYLYKGLYFFALLFLVYLIICIYGYRSWKKNM